ncbi:ribosomal protein S12 methylthiotransferase accessory factor [Saccharopolyspora erythraea NRRL 2338]|uniref:YcaO domain-containing protein n=1 Tax=Saccharopolyspora erythraea TaxID=1836 RepID=A0ABP3PAS9_SACER|nr:YcaO-like family protein [Saccharopolyspora erythraea]PFG97888.1 ribosomal protein S12 methylthiotransferase accessory factor [Saccharopolyspora erythraea NRRL 2338]
MPSGGELGGACRLWPSGAPSSSPPALGGGEPATAAIEQAALSLGLRPRWRLWAGPVSLAECDLLDEAGAPASGARGLGKGRDQAEARLYALAEALERFLTGPTSLDSAAVRFIAAEELADGVLAEEASAPLLRQLTGSEIACYAYQAVHAGQEGATIPLYLGAPWYAGQDGHVYRDRVGDRADYQGLSRYSVQSGYGLAPTQDEATVHALLETVERDACSLLTVRTFMSGRQPTVIDPHTLPEDLALLHTRAQRELDATVHLINATTDLDIPTVLAYCTPGDGTPYRRGQAAALATRDAVTAAITELLESQLPHTAPPPTALTPLKPYPALHRCARFDFTDALQRAHTTAFFDRPSPEAPRAQLDELLARLAAAGFTAYRRHVAVLPGEVSAVHTVVPGLERFFAVVKGALVLPGPRGRTC